MPTTSTSRKGWPASTACLRACWPMKRLAGRQPPELGEGGGIGLIVRNGRLERSGLVEQQHGRRMVDRIVGICPGLFRIDSIVLLDLGDLRRAAGQTDHW